VPGALRSDHSTDHLVPLSAEQFACARCGSRTNPIVNVMTSAHRFVFIRLVMRVEPTDRWSMPARAASER
jgi:hypothetical protein